MINLGLRGTELNLFAIIFGYSQQGDDGCCYATRRELARRCGVSSTTTIDTAMDSLIAKGLIIKSIIRKDDRELVAYQYNAKSAQGTQKLSTPYPKIEQGGYSKIEYMENKEDKTKEKFIPPTPQQVAEFTRSRGWNDPEGFGYHYVSYMTMAGWIMANGKHVKNWKLNVISWEPNNKHKTFAKVNVPKNPYTSIEQVKQSLR